MTEEEKEQFMTKVNVRTLVHVMTNSSMTRVALSFYISSFFYEPTVFQRCTWYILLSKLFLSRLSALLVCKPARQPWVIYLL